MVEKLQVCFLQIRNILNMIEHEVSVHFGEVLGKHSDVRTTICDSDIEMIS